MNTGDIILFKEQGKSGWLLVSWFISFFTWSRYVHVGIVLKDPEFLNLKGLYLWESVWLNTPDAEDHRKKFGVQVSPLAERLAAGCAYIRKYSGPEFPVDELVAIHTCVYDKPYDIVPIDWIEAFLHVDPNPQKTSRFWCSALVGYILTKLHVLISETDWSILSPKYFSEFENTNYGPVQAI